MKKKILIIGAGPAGLTAAFELSKQENFEIILIEQSDQVGGISKTVNYKGNRIDIGGHRFFSKSKVVMDWWMNMLPISKDGMLKRKRKSSILYRNQYFDYPLQLSFPTLKKLGFFKSIKLAYSYFFSIFKNSKNAGNLEEFFISRFGKELYQTFFKNYTEKVWGKKCTEISADWGVQRIKDLSLWKAIISVFKSKNKDVYQKDTSTSLIEEFLYPKYGPGMMWEKVQTELENKGIFIQFNSRISDFHLDGKNIQKVEVEKNGVKDWIIVDEVISSMPMKFLLRGLQPEVSQQAIDVSESLEYRDFIMVGLLFKKTSSISEDNWIYLHDDAILASRMQLFNNWSPYMVEKEKEHLWVGLEYFCNIGDEIWNQSDEQLLKIAEEDFKKCGLLSPDQPLDGTVIRMPKTYPSYTGVYEKFEVLRDEMEQFPNLYLIGRNGMHKYNNQDHSMLTAMMVAEKIIKGDRDKSDIWDINAEMEYHEE